MQGVNNQGTINVVIDSSAKQKINLHLGQTYEARVFSVSEDGKVTIKIGGQEIVAESKVPLQPGQKIVVEVKDNTNGLVLLQIKYNLSFSAKNQTNLLRESIINNLAAQNLPLKEENIVISQGLIKYNLRVSSENIQKVLNGLVSSGYQMDLADYNIVESSVLLFAKGLPLTRETIELARFLKQQKGQVINKFVELDNEIDHVIETLIKAISQNPEDVKDPQKLSAPVLKEVIENLPNKLRKELSVALFADESADQVLENLLKQGKEGKEVKKGTEGKESVQYPLKNLSSELNEQYKPTKSTELNLRNAINQQIIDTNGDHINLIQDRESSKAINPLKVLENLKLLSEIKELLNKAVLSIDPKENDINRNTSANLAETIKYVASYMVDGEKSLEGDLKEKLQGSFKDLVSKVLLDNLLVKTENNHDKLGRQLRLEPGIKEQIGKLEGSFNEISKHFEAVKLYNAGINDATKDNINNYYLLSLPTQVAGENYDNKIYFWSQGNKKRKIDPDNMRVVLCLNTQGLGLLRIDLTVAKRNIFAGIEVTDPEVKNFIEEHGSALEERLASHNYRLKTINCSLIKHEDISSAAPTEITDKFTALDLRI